MTGEREQTDPNFLRNLGEQMVTEVLEDDHTLVSVYGTNLLMNIRLAEGEIKVDPEGYEYMRDQFVGFHTTEFPPQDPLAVENLDEPEVFDGFIEGLVNKGFLQVEKGSDGIRKLTLTKQGEIEADLFNAQNEVEKAEAEAKNIDSISNARRAYKNSAEVRLKFWIDRAKEGVVLSDDEKRRIVDPTQVYGFRGLVPQVYFDQKTAEATQDLASPQA